LGWSRGEKELRVPYEQVAFSDGQEAENNFKVTCDPLKLRFLDFNQVALRACQEEENELKVPGDHL